MSPSTRCTWTQATKAPAPKLTDVESRLDRQLSEAAFAACHRAIALCKEIEDARQKVRCDTGAVIAHVYLDELQVHERGDCSAVDARSAGRYYDPLAGARQDGAVGTSPDRIVADPEGVATVDLLLRGAVLGGGADNDILGRALLVLGATPGAISARVACGVITAGK